MKKNSGLFYFVFPVLAIILVSCATANKKISPPPPEDPKRHLELAKLYSSYKNPDYGKALKEFELYLSLSPAGAGADEARDWVAVLRKLNNSQQKINQLTKSNKELKNSLDQLEHIDIEMEQKRKQTY